MPALSLKKMSIKNQLETSEKYYHLIDNAMKICFKHKKGYVDDLIKEFMNNFNITDEEAYELINLLYLLGYISFGANKDNDKSTWKLTRRAYTIYYPWWKLILHELFPSFF